MGGFKGRVVGGIVGEAEFNDVLIPRSVAVTNIEYNHGLKDSIHALERIGQGVVVWWILYSWASERSVPLTNSVPLSVRRTWGVPHLLTTISRKAFLILIP